MKRGKEIRRYETWWGHGSEVRRYGLVVERGEKTYFEAPTQAFSVRIGLPPAVPGWAASCNGGP